MAPSTGTTKSSNTGWWVAGCFGLLLIVALCAGTSGLALLVRSGPQSQPVSSAAEASPNLEGPVAGVPNLDQLDNGATGSVAQDGSSPSAAESEDPPAADPPSADPPAGAPVSTPMPQQGTDPGLNPPFIPLGEAVSTGNPIPLPPGLPDDFETMDLSSQTQAMTELIGLPLVPVPGEEGVAWVWNGKGLTTATVVCPEWVDCHVTLVSGNATVLFRGHGETINIMVGTFRVERSIPGRGGLCDNAWGASVYEASDLNYVQFLGEAAQCPYPPPYWLEKIDTQLGARRIEVQGLTGVDSVIPIGTVKKGYGAFVITQTDTEALDFNCFDGAACVVDTGSGWQWVEGPVQVTGAQAAILYDLARFDSTCEAVISAQTAFGQIADAPACSP